MNTELYRQVQKRCESLSWSSLEKELVWPPWTKLHFSISSKEVFTLIEWWESQKNQLSQLSLGHQRHQRLVLLPHCCTNINTAKPNAGKNSSNIFEPFFFVPFAHILITTFNTSPLQLYASSPSEWNPWEQDPLTFNIYQLLPMACGSWKAEHTYLLNEWSHQHIHLVQCTLLVNARTRTTTHVMLLISQICRPLVYSSHYIYFKTCMHNTRLNQSRKNSLKSLGQLWTCILKYHFQFI